VRVTGRKTVKSRLHIDLNPAKQQTEVQRLLALAATGSTSDADPVSSRRLGLEPWLTR
jgi:hypothetical protein